MTNFERLRRAGTALWSVRSEIACDASALAGGVLIVRGVLDIYPPAAFIIGGLALVALSVIWTRRV